MAFHGALAWAHPGNLVGSVSHTSVSPELGEVVLMCDCIAVSHCLGMVGFAVRKNWNTSPP